jgi:hypothetical protein
MRTIYEPEGRAAEYSPLALNLYTGCAHGAPTAMRVRWRSPGFVDFWKIGKINYDKQAEAGIDWKQFVPDARRVLGNVPHMFKKDLLRAAGEIK